MNLSDYTPYFAIGDTWFPLGVNCFKCYNNDVKRPNRPKAGIKDYVCFRKAQGHNWINMIYAFPYWKTDDSTLHMVLRYSARITMRSSWLECGTGNAINIDNEASLSIVFPG